MFNIEDFFLESNLKSHLKKYKLVLAFSFMFGFFIGSIPFIYEYIENLRTQKLIQEQRKMQLENKEKICKKENSEYKKFLNLGFPKTAIEKFDICMKE